MISPAGILRAAPALDTRKVSRAAFVSIPSTASIQKGRTAVPRLLISAFSFIGFTLGDEVIDWGSMLASARKLMGVKPSLLFYPSLFIFLSTVSFNMLGRLFQKENTDHA